MASFDGWIRIILGVVQEERRLLAEVMSHIRGGGIYRLWDAADGRFIRE
jgi:hypothetical protein